MIKLLLEYGAKLDVVRHNGETPAHGAAMYGHINVLEELGRLGCDLQAKSHAGETPKMCAERCHQVEAVDYLTKHE